MFNSSLLVADNTSAAAASVPSSVVESALGVSTSKGGEGKTPRSRRNSRRSSSIAAAPLRIPVYCEEVASRIADAAEGTVHDWPYTQEPVDRINNPLLTIEEIKHRYGTRHQLFEPNHDVSRDASEVASSSPPRRDHFPNSPSSGSRIVTSPRRESRKVRSNKQLVEDVAIARKLLKRKIRDEALRNRFVTLVLQWKARVVDVQPQQIEERVAHRYDQALDPVYLHQEAMRGILEDERVVADQLIEQFQRMAREAEELRHQREREDAEADRLLALQRPHVPQDQTFLLDQLINPLRSNTVREPLSRRFEPAPEVLMLTSASTHHPEVTSPFLPRLPPAATLTSLTQPQAVFSNRKAMISPPPPLVTFLGPGAAGNVPPLAEQRKAPWAKSLDALSSLQGGFEASHPQHIQSPKPKHSPSKQFAPSSSALVGASVKAMVEASVASHPPPNHSRRRSTVRSTSHATDEEGHQMVDGDGDSEDVDILEADWANISIPQDAEELDAMHERLVTDAAQLCGLVAPHELFCALCGKIMSDPIILMDEDHDASGNNTEVMTLCVDRRSWERELVTAPMEFNMNTPPTTIAILVAQYRADPSRVRIKSDVATLKMMMTWRSTAMTLLFEESMLKRESVHISSTIVLDILDSVYDQCVRLTAESLDSNGRGGGGGGRGMGSRKAYPVNMMLLRAGALEAVRKVNALIPLMQSVRAETQKRVQAIDAMTMRLGVFERDLRRLQIRQSQSPSAAAAPTNSPRHSTHSTEPDMLSSKMTEVKSEIRLLDAELLKECTSLLELDRRFSELRANRVAMSDRIDAFNEHVDAYNNFVKRQRAHWGPVYKASVSACYTVLALLFDRKMEPSMENRMLLAKIADYVDLPSARALMAQLPELYLRFEGKMKQLKLPLVTLSLKDAAFVLMNREAQFEDTLPFEPLMWVPYPLVTGEGPLMSLHRGSVQAGIDMLRRKSLFPLPQSPRVLAQQRHAVDSSHSRQEERRVVRPIGSDPQIPFWYFVRKDGDGTAANDFTGIGNETPNQMSGANTARTLTTGIRGTNVATPTTSNSARVAVERLPQNRFLAQPPMHTRKLTPKNSTIESDSSHHFSSLLGLRPAVHVSSFSPAPLLH